MDTASTSTPPVRRKYTESLSHPAANPVRKVQLIDGPPPTAAAAGDLPTRVPNPTPIRRRQKKNKTNAPTEPGATPAPTKPARRKRRTSEEVRQDKASVMSRGEDEEGLVAEQEGSGSSSSMQVGDDQGAADADAGGNNNDSPVDRLLRQWKLVNNSASKLCQKMAQLERNLPSLEEHVDLPGKARFQRLQALAASRKDANRTLQLMLQNFGPNLKLIILRLEKQLKQDRADLDRFSMLNDDLAKRVIRLRRMVPAPLRNKHLASRARPYFFSSFGIDNRRRLPRSQHNYVRSTGADQGESSSSSSSSVGGGAALMEIPNPITGREVEIPR